MLAKVILPVIYMSIFYGDVPVQVVKFESWTKCMEAKRFVLPPYEARCTATDPKKELS